MAVAKSTAVTVTALRLGKHPDGFTLDTLEDAVDDRFPSVTVSRATIEKRVRELVQAGELERDRGGGPNPDTYRDAWNAEQRDEDGQQARERDGAAQTTPDATPQPESAVSGERETDIASSDEQLIATDGGAVPIDELERDDVVTALEAYADRLPRDAEADGWEQFSAVPDAGKVSVTRDNAGRPYERIVVDDQHILIRFTDD